MRLANLKLPLGFGVAVALAFALDLDSGCVDDADNADDAAQLATADQAIEVAPGEMLEPIQGAFEVIHMIKNLSEFGTPIVSTGDLLAKLDEIGEDIKALSEKVKELQGAMQELKGFISVSAATTALANIEAVMSYWRAASADEASKPGTLAAFYQNVRNGVPNGYGVIDLATLLELNDFTQAAIRDNATFLAGQPLDRSAELGTYAAGIRLRLAEGFFLISLAKQDQGAKEFAPGGTQVLAQKARLAAFDANFFQANDTMNRALVAAQMQARQAPVLHCEGHLVTRTTNGWTFKDLFSNPNGTISAVYSSYDACEGARYLYVLQQQAIVGTQVMGEIITAQTAFTGWTQATDNAGLTSTLHVDKATYGTGDVTPYLRSACDGRGACDFTVANLGDPNPNVAKAFEVTYRCGAEPAGVPAFSGGDSTKTLRLTAEAGGQKVQLTCKTALEMTPIDNGERLVGNYRTLVPDAVVPAASKATISFVDYTTIKFTRGDGYSWNLTQTPDQQGTLQFKVVDGIPLSLGIYYETITLDPDGNVRGILQPDGTFYAHD